MAERMFERPGWPNLEVSAVTNHHGLGRYGPLNLLGKDVGMTGMTGNFGDHAP
jgi:hypothetical protein